MGVDLTTKEKAARDKRLQRIDVAIKRAKAKRKAGRTADYVPPGKTLKELKAMRRQITHDPRHGRYVGFYRDPESERPKTFMGKLRKQFQTGEHYHPWEHKETDPGD